MASIQTLVRFNTDEREFLTVNKFSVPAGTDLSTTPLILQSVINHATALTRVVIVTDVALTGTTTLDLALVNAEDLCEPVKILNNLAASSLAVPAAATTAQFELGKHLGLPISIIRDKAPNEEFVSYRLAIYGDAALTNTSPVTVTVLEYTTQIHAHRNGPLTIGGSTVQAATN